MKRIETYKHRMAKHVLREWFEPKYIVKFEMKFYIENRIAFVPDVTLLDNNIVTAIYEIVHKHGLTGKKLGLIQYWSFLNYPVPVYEINADYILGQMSKPELIISDCFITEFRTHELLKYELQ